MEKEFEIKHGEGTIVFTARRIKFKESQAYAEKFFNADGSWKTGQHNGIAYAIALLVMKPWFECEGWSNLPLTARIELLGERDAFEVGLVGKTITEYNEVPTEKK